MLLHFHCHCSHHMTPGDYHLLIFLIMLIILIHHMPPLHCFLMSRLMHTCPSHASLPPHVLSMATPELIAI